MPKVVAPLVTGTVLSTAAVTGLAWTDPAPDWGFPPLSVHHPVQSWLALTAAPLGSPWPTLATAAAICALCFFTSWARAARHRPDPATTEDLPR